MTGQAVMLSIRPKWCALIASGQKTVEIRRNRPKLEMPFKVYIYCSIGKVGDSRELLETHGQDGKIRKCNGHVFAEFICDEILPLDVPYPAYMSEINQDILDAACLSYVDVHRYGGSGKRLYGWHISDLVIYEKPRTLGEFLRWQNPGEDLLPCHNRKLCENAIYDFERNEESCAYDYDSKTCPYLFLSRPPQSWYYVDRERSHG